MSKSAEAWMPLYVGDYLGDTQRLTTEQHGAYFLLILDYWRNGPAPDDDAVLQAITKQERGAWKRNRPAIERLFKVADGVWRHKRIDAEIEKAKANQERRSEKAAKAAQARWGDAPSNAPSMPQAKHVECPPPSPSSSPKGSEETSEAKASSVARAPARKTRERALAHRLPFNFEPVLTEDAQRIVDSWPPGVFEREMAQWRDHHTAKGTTAKDWQASLRTWLRKADDYRTERNGRQLQTHRTGQSELRGSRPDPSLDMWRQADAEERAASAGHSQDHRGAWPALPAQRSG